MRICCIAFILIGAYFNICKAANSDSNLFLIPQPKRVEVWNGAYNFSKPYKISVVNTNDFYAKQLQETIEQKLSEKPSTALSPANKISLIRQDSSDLYNTLKGKQISLPFVLGSEGYVISVTAGEIMVIATENAGVFYGVQTLIQLINANSTGSSIPCLIIYDKPDMTIRGWQDDISRGPIPTLHFMKEQVRKMSSFKLNTFTLYTEHVFRLKKHPDIAPADGITAEEMKELCDYAAKYHVDIIGNFQSFGHFKKILNLSSYKHLAENEQTLSPAKEDSYKFLKEVYSEIAPAYSSKYFHINCDEVTLGSGPSKHMIDSIGIDGVYAKHINRIDSLLKPYGKKIMMWGDIAAHNPKIFNQLPRDMILVPWGYGEMETMEEEILPFVKSGLDFIVAPGVSCWNNIYPDMERASINIYNYLRDGYKNNAMGFINTTWDDDGQNLFNNNWYSLTWGADCGWNAPLYKPVEESEVIRENRVASFNYAYNRIWYKTAKNITSLLHSISALKYGPVKNCLSTASIWIALLPDYNVIPENYERDNTSLIKTIDSLSIELTNLKSDFAGNDAEFDALSFALRQARLVASKNLLSIKLKNCIREDEIKDISYFEDDFALLTDTVEALKSVYGKLWALENRNWWLDTVYALYDSFHRNLTDMETVCIIKASDKLIKGKREIRLQSAFNNHPVYYTTDRTIPTLMSTEYTRPLYTDSTIHIMARVIDKDIMYAVSADSIIFHKGIGKLYKLSSKWNTDNPVYAARGELGLLDGRKGSADNFNDGRWQAFFGNDVDIELDLGEVTSVNKITMGFAQLMRYGILFPQQIEVSTSTDGSNYTLVETEINTIDPNTEKRSTHSYIVALNGIQTRYLRIVARNTPVLPEWHYAKGKTGWLFADEIIVE